MPFSSDGATGSVPAAAPCSPSGLPTTTHKRDKLLLADLGRMLGLTASSNQRHRQQALRLQEAQIAKEMGQSLPPASGDDMGDILIDSPTYNMPQAPPPKSGLLKGAALGAALLAGGAALSTGAWCYAVRPVPSPAAPDVAKPAPSAPAEAWDAIYEQQQPDGSWKQVKREHLVRSTKPDS